jgi:ubiquitin-protein ligase
MSSAPRISKELAEVSKVDDVSGVRAVPISSDPHHLSGTIKGPIGTPYEGRCQTVQNVTIHPVDPILTTFTLFIFRRGV